MLAWLPVRSPEAATETAHRADAQPLRAPEPDVPSSERIGGSPQLDVYHALELTSGLSDHGSSPRSPPLCCDSLAAQLGARRQHTPTLRTCTVAPKAPVIIRWSSHALPRRSAPLCLSLRPQNMQKRLVLCLTVLPTFWLAPPKVDCRALDATADTSGTIIPDVGSGRAVVGRRRVPVYSAPDLACPIVGVFIIRGDELYAQLEYNGFTRVAIFPVRKTDSNDIIAWVRTTRVTANGKGIVPGTRSF
jgi:hypothetical protein